MLTYAPTEVKSGLVFKKLACNAIWPLIGLYSIGMHSALKSPWPWSLKYYGDGVEKAIYSVSGKLWTMWKMLALLTAFKWLVSCSWPHHTTLIQGKNPNGFLEDSFVGIQYVSLIALGEAVLCVFAARWIKYTIGTHFLVPVNVCIFS
jgi:hypothetical protein